MLGKFTWGNKAKHCWVMSTNFLFSKVSWQCPAMFCLYTSSKLYRTNFQTKYHYTCEMYIICTSISMYLILIPKGEKVCLSCIGKTLLGDVNKLFVFKSLLTKPSNALPLHLTQTFPPITWIFIEGEGDGIESRKRFKKFST